VVGYLCYFEKLIIEQYAMLDV